MVKTVDAYLEQGCGRCPLFDTPDCKVHRWEGSLRLLRRIVLECGLSEEVKWGMPCYTFQNKNVLLLAAFKEYVALSFFKGSLLEDSQQLLQTPGEQTQGVRYLRFSDSAHVSNLEELIKAYIFEAIELEKSGKTISLKSISDYEVVEEFQAALENLPDLRAAYQKLSPGRQRSFLLHFAQAKQAKTRESRIEKCIPLILAGKGLDDDYRAKRS